MLAAPTSGDRGGRRRRERRYTSSTSTVTPSASNTRPPARSPLRVLVGQPRSGSGGPRTCSPRGVRRRRCTPSVPLPATDQRQCSVHCASDPVVRRPLRANLPRCGLGPGSTTCRCATALGNLAPMTIKRVGILRFGDHGFGHRRGGGQGRPRGGAALPQAGDGRCDGRRAREVAGQAGRAGQARARSDATPSSAACQRHRPPR